jgi:hypothetical protein
MPLAIQLHPFERQTAFNLERWRELLADRDLARLPHRIETDRHGHILMGPPPAPKTGKYALGWRQLTEDWWTAPVMCNSGSNGMHLAIAMFFRSRISDFRRLSSGSSVSVGQAA